jgi:hypothetical protein
MTNSIRSAKLSPIRMERQLGTVKRLAPALINRNGIVASIQPIARLFSRGIILGGASMLIQRQIPGP